LVGVGLQNIGPGIRCRVAPWGQFAWRMSPQQSDYTPTKTTTMATTKREEASVLLLVL
jgi:hypothetical protein